MEIVARSKLKIDRLLKLACIAAGVGVLVFFLFWLLFLLLYPWEPKEIYDPINTRNTTQSTSLFSYEAIGSGALALNPQQTYGWVTEIARELLVIAHNSRPDVLQRESHLLVALKHSKEQKHILNGKTLYLDEGQQDRSLKFSEGPQSLWIKPILLDNGGVLVEVGRKLGALDAPHSEEKGQFVVQTNQTPGKSSSNFQQPFAKALKDARVWGIDQLIQKYGGREYAGWKEKYKLDFSHEGNPYACFVSTGDQLVWDKQRWRVVGPDEVTMGRPLALVKSVSSKGLDIGAWDESGFSSILLTLSLEHAPKFNGRVEGMPSALRLRTATQVSCLLGKKRLILRQGDWILKTSTGWRALRHSQDIEQCLNHQLRGELFIVDALEKEQGRWVLKIDAFDEMRTQIQSLRIPIEAEKKTAKSGKKRKLPFATKSALPLWFSHQIERNG